MNTKYYSLFLNNPEFTRNLWSNFSWLSFILVLFLLGNILVFTQYNGGNYAIFHNIYLFFFLCIMGFWGTQNTINSFLQEFKQGTWDYQRLSTISPCQMLIGKLFGASFLQWLLGGIIFIAMLVHFTFLPTPANLWIKLSIYWATLTLIILILQCQVLINFLLLWRKGSKKATQKHASSSIAFIILAGSLYFSFSGDNRVWTTSPTKTVHLFGIFLTTAQYVLILTSLLLAWSLIGLYNLFRSEFGQKVSPLWWAGFLIFAYLINYGTNFVNNNPLTHHSLLPFISMNAIISALSIYIMLYYANKNAVFWVRLGRYWQYNSYKKLFYSIPCWLISYILTIVLAISACIYNYLESSPTQATNVLLITTSFLLFITRDVLLILYLNLARQGKYLIIIFLLLYLSYPLNIQNIPSGLFFPSIAGGSASRILAIISPLVQIGIIVSLFKINWHNFMPSFKNND